MKGLGAFLVLLAALAVVEVARSGHEFPVYPSYYPHEIAIETMPSEHAADLLRDAKLQAYLGAEPRFPSPAPTSRSEFLPSSPRSRRSCTDAACT